MNRESQEREIREWRAAYRRLQALSLDDSDDCSDDCPDDCPNDCPNDEVLAGLVVDDADPSDRIQLADHIVGCQNCRERYQILRELHDEARRQIGPSRRRPWQSRLAIAAAVVLVGILIAPWIDGGLEFGPSDDTVRGSELTVAVEPAPGGVLTDPPPRLSWPAVIEGEPVRVRLLDSNGEVVWETEATSSYADLSAEVRAQLEPGSSYFWVVDSLRRADSRLGPFWFELAN